jgi:hypothetical protein
MNALKGLTWPQGYVISVCFAAVLFAHWKVPTSAEAVVSMVSVLFGFGAGHALKGANGGDA